MKNLGAKRRLLAFALGLAMVLTQTIGYPHKMPTVKAQTGAVVGELTGNSECYTSINVTDAGTEITYLPGTWHTLDCTVTEHDVTKQGKLEIVVVPAREGMELAIFGNGDEVALRPTWGTCTFDSAEERTLVYDLDTNLTSIRFYCDPNQAGLEAQTFTIKSIRFLDNETAPTDDTGIVLDGALDDWEYIQKMAKDTGIFTQVAACRTADSVYLMYELKEPSVFNTDQVLFGINGVTTGGYNNTGISYMLQSDILYSYSGTDGGWGWTATTVATERQLSADKAIGEYKIPVSAFGTDVTAISVNMGIIDTTWASAGSYPAAASSLENIPLYEDAHIETTSVPIANFAFTAVDDLKTLSGNTSQGGVAGSFSAEGGDGANYSYALVDSPVYGLNNASFTISGNQLVVADKQLKPGVYKVYVKVTSDIREEKQEFSLTVGAADSSTPITEEIFSGAKDEWFAVSSSQVNADPNLLQLKAVSDGTYLYGYVSAAALEDSFEFYIAVDGKAGADMSDVWTDGTAVSYKVDAAGHLYRYEDSQWADTGKTAAIYKENGGAEWKVAVSDITDSSAAFRVGVMENQSSVLPNRNQSMLTVTSPIMTAAPAITADGDPSDWQAITPLAEGEGTIGSLYAVRDNQYLYVMTYVKEADITNFQGISTNLYINTDADKTTGYQHAGYPAFSGADFLVQDWCSVTVGENTKNTEYFYRTDNSSAWTWSVQGSGKDYKAYAATAEDGVYCVEYAIPISDLKAATPLISDDLYIAVDREWIADTLPAGYAPARDAQNGSFVKVPKYQTTFEISLEDSSFADWSVIPGAVGNAATDTLYNLYATRSQERLYTLVTSENSDFTTANTYYLDTDSSVGYVVDTYTGVDYVVKDAKLYQVTADNTLGSEVCSVDMDYYADSIKMQVYLEDLGNPETILIAFHGKGYDGTTYDDTTRPNKDLVIPADGSYLNADASFTMYREEGLYYPKESFDSFANPYTGWVGWAEKYGSDQQSVYDYNLIYVGIKWSEFEPAEGQYDFDALEEKYHISEQVAQGKRINLRFIMDNPDTVATEKCMDIPKWLYDKLVEENGADGAGTFYFREDLPGGIAGSSGSGFSPNYNSALLMQYHEKAIAALAEKYNDPSIVAYVQVGSLGHWGEFHTWPEGTGVFPTPEIATKYMEPYTKYFTNVKVGLRKPYPYAAANDFGLFNDVFGVSQWAATPSWLKWIQDGCTDMGAGATAADVENSKMPDWWKVNYSGGEFASGNVRLHLTDAGTIGCLQQVRDSHTTWLGPCSATMLYTEDEDSYTYKANVEAMQKAMGYRFSLRSVTEYAELKAGETVTLDMCWDNKGVAPFYYNWYVEISLIGADGKVAYSELKDVAMNEWLPGSARETVTFDVPENLPNGSYTVAVAIADSDTEEPAMKLAMTGDREDLRYPLYQVALSGSKAETPDDNTDGGDTDGEGNTNGGDTNGEGNTNGGGNTNGEGNTNGGGNTSGGDANGGGNTSGGDTNDGGSTSGGGNTNGGDNTNGGEDTDTGENTNGSGESQKSGQGNNSSPSQTGADRQKDNAGKTITAVPKTGDESFPIWIMILGVIAALAGVMALGIYRKNKEQQE